MTDSSLQDRLREHAKAFDGLLSLIPAKMYYGEDTSGQWKKKKQTKAEAAAARKAKLDPDSELNRNAKEVMDERAKSKRKLQDMQDEEDDGANDVIDGVKKEIPGQGLKKKDTSTNKKQKVTQPTAGNDKTVDAVNRQERNAEKMAARKEKKEKTHAARLAKKLAKKAGSSTAPTSSSAKSELESAKLEDDKVQSKKRSSKQAELEDGEPSRAETGKNQKPLPVNDPKISNTGHDIDEDYETVSSSDSEDGENGENIPSELQPLDIIGLDQTVEESATSSAASAPQSPTFDANDIQAQNLSATNEAASAATSINSTVPPSEKPKHIKLPADTSALRARLAARIEALRAARKADGPDGKPIRTRQELIEARRAKQAQRKAHKKELRRLAKLDEDRKRDEVLASHSPSVMSPGVDHDDGTSNFTFGRVGFSDNSKLSHDLSYVLSDNKTKGPSDPKTALLKLQNQKKRIAALDEEKQKDIAEKELWLTARRRAEGEKIRDDETLLKKAVKRKETRKKRSEKEWKERAQGVQNAIQQRQKKREDNLRQRREDKLAPKGKKGKKGGAGGAKKKGRPGFEGGSLGGGKRKK